MDKIFKMPKEDAKLTIGRKWLNSWLVNYPVSYRYNGGIVINGTWYEGIEVPSPKVPKGFKLVGIGVGLQMNSQPPYATSYLKPIDDRKVSKRELKHILASL